MWNNSLYGNFRTRTFAEIFPSSDEFAEFYEDCGIPTKLLSGTDYEDYSIETIYALLVSHYANNCIKSSDENRFKLELMTIIFQYGAIWQKEMATQDKILNLTDEELLVGSKAIYNQARNPSTVPSTGSLQELTYIDNQNTTQYAKAKGEGYASLSAYLDPNITRRFMDKFKKLFIIVLYPGEALWYVEEDTI